MKTNTPLYIYGTIIISEGILLITSPPNTLYPIKYTLSIGLIVASILAFITAFSRTRKQIQFAYHEMHALTMLAYGLAIAFLCHSLEVLFYFTAFLLFFYAISEIIFCNWLYNLKNKIIYKTLIIRVLISLITGVGTVFSLNDFQKNSKLSMIEFGLLFILIGINVILYVPIIQHKDAVSDKL